MLSCIPLIIAEYENLMPYYRAFNLNIFSELALPGQLEGNETPQTIDINIRFGAVSPTGINAPLTHSYCFQTNKKTFWLNVPKIARFLVENGNTITIDPAPELDKTQWNRLSLWVLESCFSTLLMQRGLFLLHANAIDIGDSVILLAGERGAGKSTLSMGLLQQGSSLLTDDLCVINKQGVILPGFANVKLWKNAALHFALDTASPNTIHPTENIVLIPTKTVAQHSKPISAIYYLEPQSIDEIKISYLSNEEQAFFLTLMSDFPCFPAYLRGTFMMLQTRKILSQLQSIPFIKIAYPQQTKWIAPLIQIIKNPTLPEASESIQHESAQITPAPKKMTIPKTNRIEYIMMQLKNIWFGPRQNSSLTKKIFWLSSYPKSGNTWLRIFLFKIHQLTNQSVVLDELNGIGLMPTGRTWLNNFLGFDSGYLTDNEMDVIRNELSQWFAALQKDTLYYKAHEAYLYFPDNTPKVPVMNSLGVVYLVRNPLDVTVSLANHYNCSIDKAIEHMNNLTFEIAGLPYGHQPRVKQMYQSWSLHVKSWLEAKDINRLVVRYEDMKQQPLETFTSIVKFLNLDVSTETVQQALEQSRFEKLQAIEAESGFSEAPTHGNRFFRKGIVGDWKNTLTEEQVNRIVSAHSEVMKTLGYLDENGNP